MFNSYVSHYQRETYRNGPPERLPLSNYSSKDRNLHRDGEGWGAIRPWEQIIQSLDHFWIIFLLKHSETHGDLGILHLKRPHVPLMKT
jgi:hypothetical protein